MTVQVFSTDTGSLLWQGDRDELETTVEFFQTNGTDVRWAAR